MIKEVVYTGYRNTIELNISSVGGLPIDHSKLTRCQLNLSGTLLDSAVNSTYFDLTQTDRIILTLGLAGLPARNYNATLIIFDDFNVAGLVVGSFELLVV